MNWINGKIRNASLARMIIAIIVMAIVVLLLIANARYFKNYFSGPQEVTPVQLNAATSADSLERYWVKLRADEVMETGFQEITIKKKHGVERSRSVSATYFVARVGKRLLLVKVHGEGKPSPQLTGFMKDASGTADRAFFDDPEVQKIRSTFYPMMLDTDDFQTDGTIGLFAASVFFIGALAYGVVALNRFRNPASHPVFKRLRQWGDPGKIGAEIEAESKDQTMKFGGYLFTSNYAIRNETLNFDIRRLDDVLWAYKQVIQNKIYYVIPAGKTFALCLNWMDESINIKGKESGVDAFLEHLIEQKPWIVFGYNEDLAALYSKKRNDFAAAVADRRKEAEASAGN